MKERLCVTDFHSHILPVDHGCKDIQQTVKQLALMHSFGTQAVVATPHFYPEMHTVSDFSSLVDNALFQVRQMEDIKSPALFLGAEVLFCHNLHKMEGIDSLCIKGTKIILLELTSDVEGNGQAECVEQLLANGYTVVLAHIDRYLKANDHSIRDLISLGAKAQINADAFYSVALQKKLRYYLEDTDSVVAIGSDLHGNNKISYLSFSKLSKHLGDTYGRIMKQTESLLEDAQRIL